MDFPKELMGAIYLSGAADNLCHTHGSGIISVRDTGVCIAEFLFHQLFSTWCVEEVQHESDYITHYHNVDGVKVYCLSWKGGERP